MTRFTSRISTEFSKRIAIVLVLVLAVCPCVFAVEAKANIQVLSLHESVDFLLEFDDTLFDIDARTYNHEMAVTSMCMAMSAFRPYKSESNNYSSPDESLLAFLTSAGFSDFVSDDYDKNPSLYTVATAIGQKTLTDSKGNPYTVIAVGVCGGGYADEWLSNFTVGNGNRHKGFDSAAHMVVNRIFGYIGTRNITGRIKVWISGYSRAAAVSNIAAADLTSSGFFREEDVFAYTFATPNTVKNPEREYSNIFNIVGQYDIVPMVPLSVWGYTRYGKVLTTPLQETDSDYISRVQAGPDEVHRMFTGTSYWNNVELNNELHSMLSFLAEICPTTEIYEKCLQDRIISIMSNRNPVNILRNLFEIADDQRLITEENRDEANQFINRFARLIYNVLTGSTDNDQWNSDTPIMANLAHEHGPEVYFSWVMGGNSKVSFTENHAYATVGIYPIEKKWDYVLKVVDESDGSVVAEVENSVVTYYSETFHPHVAISPDRALFRLPLDGKFSIVVEGEDSCEYAVIYMPTEPAGFISEDIYLTFKTVEGGRSVAFTTGMNMTDEWDFFSAESDGFNENEIRLIQGYEKLPVSWKTIVISLIVSPIVLIMFITWIALFVSSKVRKTHFRSLDYLLGCTFVLLAIFDSFFMLIVRGLVYQLLIRVLIGLVLFLVSRKRGKGFTAVSALLLVFSVANLVLVLELTVSLCLMAAGYIFMIVICLRKKKLAVNRIIYWVACSAILCALLRFRLDFSILDLAMVSAAALIPFAAWDYSQGFRNAGLLLLVQDVAYKLFLYSVDRYISLYLFYMSAFYLALLIIAMSEKKPKMEYNTQIKEIENG